MNLANVARSVAVSREGIEVHRFGLPAAIIVPLLAVMLQASLQLRFAFFSIFDLPLLVTIFFGVARRNQIIGTLTGCAIGLFQDALTQLPLGLFGIAKSVIGYGASSIGVKVDVENPGSRLLMTFAFYLVHRGLYQLVARNMAQLPRPWSWPHELGAALANALLAVVLFYFLDKLKQRG
jgi:rod shape-determining protein MreD